VQFDKPETAIEYDIDPKKAVQTRLKQFANFAKNGQTIAAPHLPFPGLDIFIQQMERAINGFLYILKIKTNELILGNKKATFMVAFYSITSSQRSTSIQARSSPHLQYDQKQP
jgi:hypothetical protein